jgi:hypothetical protein
VGKPHTLGEELILLAARELVFIIYGENTMKQLYSVPQSNNTVSHKTKDMAASIKDIVVKPVCSSKYFCTAIR